MNGQTIKINNLQVTLNSTGNNILTKENPHHVEIYNPQFKT